MERKFTLPSNEACIIFNKDLFKSKEEDLETMFFDNGIPLEDKKIPFKDHSSYSEKIRNTILLIRRKSGELEIKHNELRQEQVKPQKGFRAKTQKEIEVILDGYIKK